jgi:uncharacterized membrane protein YgcG
MPTWTYFVIAGVTLACVGWLLSRIRADRRQARRPDQQTSARLDDGLLTSAAQQPKGHSHHHGDEGQSASVTPALVAGGGAFGGAGADGSWSDTSGSADSGGGDGGGGGD